MSASAVHPQLPLGLTLRDSARFENYYPGDNAEAVTMLQSIAAGGGEAAVYLAGQAGMGKSHLLQAACYEAAQNERSASYLPLAELQAKPAEVLDGLECMQLLCIDDIDVVAGRHDWETAIFNLFNSVRAASGAMLFAGCRKPGACGFLLPDLVTRLGWGLSYGLKPLNETQLQAALLLRARGRGLELPEDTAQFLLKRVTRDLSSVFDLFERLDEASMVEKRRLTIPFVKSVLGIS